MELGLIFQFLTYLISIISALLILYHVYKDEKINYDDFIRMYENQKQDIKNEIKNGAKEIETIEKQIFLCKKKLGFNKNK